MIHVLLNPPKSVILPEMTTTLNNNHHTFHDMVMMAHCKECHRKCEVFPLYPTGRNKFCPSVRSSPLRDTRSRNTSIT